MNGPGHFSMAEALLERASTDRTIPDDVAAALLATAQVHATLALAAATAAAAATAYDGDEDHSRSRGWAGVA